MLVVLAKGDVNPDVENHHGTANSFGTDHSMREFDIHSRGANTRNLEKEKTVKFDEDTGKQETIKKK